ncbi:hypothetical protein V8C43DRAFT_328013 [Trichoderma afarasin]
MSGNDNAQSENQIARYMLVVQSSNLYYDQDYFEISVRQTIRQPDSTIVFWYEGYAILGFETIADYEATEEDLQDHEACGCVIRISRQEKFALEVIQAAARAAAVASASAASVSAPTAAVRTTPAPAPAPVQAGSAAVTEIEDDGTGWATDEYEEYYEEYYAEYDFEIPEVEYDSSAPVRAGSAAVTEIEDDGTGWATHPYEEYYAEYGFEIPEVEYDSD